MKKVFKYVLGIAFVGLVFNSCKKSEDAVETKAASSPYYVRMTDDEGPYNSVNIDLQGVEVTGNNGSSVMLSAHQGVYNLLNFSNNKDTLIGTGNLSFSSVEQIRLILGSNNTVVVNNVSYPLSTPSAQQSGLKLQVHQTLQPGVAYAVLLDFDANQSIVNMGNGQYQLKPVIRTVDVAISGSIKGKITPVGTVASVKASANGTDYFTVVDSNGNFVVRGIPAGTYSVTVTPAAPLHAVTVANIVVTIGNSTDVGTIQL